MRKSSAQWKVLLIAIIIPIVCLTVFTACGQQRSFTVTFNNNSGDTEAYPQTITVTGSAATVQTLPLPPSREGYDFIGWRTAIIDGASFTYTTIVNRNITVYAEWQDVRERFHIYLAFGQSNMVGWLGAGIGSFGGSVSHAWVSEFGYDNPPDNFFVMAAANNNHLPYGRQLGGWYPAVPPLVRRTNGLSPADFFGRTIAEAVADQNIKIGIIVVAIDGVQLNMFSPDLDEFKTYITSRVTQTWERNQGVAYVDVTVGHQIPTTDFFTVDFPYKRLVDLARKAQEVGVIKGIIMHHGEFGAAPGTVYNQMVRRIYDSILADLNLAPGSIPFLAGQATGNDNPHIASIPYAFTDIPNTAFVISSEGVPSWDPYGGWLDIIHFSLAGYEELGRRYGRKMLELLYD